MTGIVKSAGCKVCKQRRIKCDETTPQCLRCQKIGRDCPGPDPQFRFVHQQRQNAGQQEGSRSSSKNRSKKEATPFLVKQQKKAQDGGLYQTMEILPGSSKWRKKTAAFPQGVQMSDTDRLASSFVEILNTTPSRPGLSISTMADFFIFIPSRIGRNRTLDAAVSCVVRGYRSLASQLPNNQKCQNDSAYLGALTNLQLSLDDPRERSSAETLCGALVLAMYEIFRSKSPDEIQWLAHAGGAAAILQARGPESFTTDFEQCMLLAHHENVVFCSIIQGTTCYLNSDEWLSALEQSLGELPATNPLVNADRIYHSTLHALGTLPELIHQLRALGPDIAAAEQYKLLQIAQQFKARLLALAPFLEAEVFDGETVRQRSFGYADSDFKQQQIVFPPPLDQWSGEVHYDLRMHYVSHSNEDAVRQQASPEPLSSSLRLEFSSRSAAKRHLLYWTAVIFSNILLIRLNPQNYAGGADGPSPGGLVHPRANLPHSYYHQEKKVERSRTPESGWDNDAGERATHFPGQSSSNMNPHSWKQADHTTHKTEHYRSATSLQNRPAFMPFIPTNQEVSNSTFDAVPSPEAPGALSDSDLLPADVASYYQYLHENLDVSFLSSLDPQLPSPPEDFSPAQSGIDHRLLSHYPASTSVEHMSSLPANLDIDHLTLPSDPQHRSPHSSTFLPRTFLTSSTISPFVQNTYLHSLILRSLPYVYHDKPLGALYILFPFQMAAAISTPAQKEWIAAALTDMFSELHLKFSRDKTWMAPTFMDDVDQIARDAGIFYGERPQ